VRITVLADNRRNPARPDLGAEHGLSLFVDTGQNRILFDTGASDLFLRNARLLQVDLAGVDAAILSHGHYDHGGGLAAFFEVNARAPVHVGPGALDPHLVTTVGPLRKSIGLDANALSPFLDRLVTVGQEKDVAAGVIVMPATGADGGRPSDISRFFRKAGGTVTADDFSHEIIAVVAEPAGLIVLTGCSHKGILNIVSCVKSRFPGRPIKAIVGGLHMMNPSTKGLAESPGDITAAGEALRDDPAVQRLYAGHCTGEQAFALLRQVMGSRIEQLMVGARIEV
jgi:7,8-dihydropterin-6-yl-methyl-4-(beta-D-ribofuranosyl)aminobenzene 5'-phosphate synthase